MLLLLLLSLTQLGIIKRVGCCSSSYIFHGTLRCLLPPGNPPKNTLVVLLLSCNLPETHAGRMAGWQAGRAGKSNSCWLHGNFACRTLGLASCESKLSHRMRAVRAKWEEGGAREREREIDISSLWHLLPRSPSYVGCKSRARVLLSQQPTQPTQATHKRLNW